MSSICNDDSRNEAIAVMLEKIPNSKEDATELLSLCPILEQNEKCINCLNTMLTFLKLFDVIKVTQADEAGRIKIKARSSTASYFLRSLAEYIRNNLILVTNWQRTEAGDDLPAIQVLDLGSVSLLYGKQACKRIQEFNPY